MAINTHNLDDARDALCGIFGGCGVVIVVVDPGGRHIEYRTNMPEALTDEALAKVQADLRLKQGGHVSPIELPPWRRR